MKEMGFDANRAKKALEANRMDVTRAMNWLIEQDEIQANKVKRKKKEEPSHHPTKKSRLEDKLDNKKKTTKSNNINISSQENKEPLKYNNNNKDSILINNKPSESTISLLEPKQVGFFQKYPSGYIKFGLDLNDPSPIKLPPKKTLRLFGSDVFVPQ